MMEIGDADQDPETQNQTGIDQGAESSECQDRHGLRGQRPSRSPIEGSDREIAADSYSHRMTLSCRPPVSDRKWATC